MIRQSIALCLILCGSFKLYSEEVSIYPALAVEMVEVDDEALLARLVAEADAKMREQQAIPIFLRAYVARSTSGQVTEAFLLSPSLTFSGLLENRRVFATDADFESLREQFAVSAPSGSTMYLKAARFDGTHTPGTLLNTLLMVEDEALLLEAIEAWLAAMDPAARPKVNVFRVIAGESEFSHLVSLNCASVGSLAATMDYLGTEPLFRANRGVSGSGHRIVHQSIFEELTVD